MAAHQNAAKRLKALLRRVHFPVQRFKQLHDNSGSSNVSGGGGSGGGSSGSVNSWDGIVGGDPRAALVVLHWTLLDMSPLFVTWLLDRNHSGLQSLPDHKFVWTCLKMLRDEFGFRPQLTVSLSGCISVFVSISGVQISCFVWCLGVLILPLTANREVRFVGCIVMCVLGPLNLNFQCSIMSLRNIYVFNCQ